MRKLVTAVSAIAAIGFASGAMAGSVCTKIQGGGLIDSQGNPISTGYDQWGYNYQAHMFNGLYDNFSRPAVPATEGDINLMMKWSDDWLSNQDCDQDGLLDRGGDGTTGHPSKGWLTNHEEGDYEDGGEYYHYTYFVKIVFDDGAACQNGADSCIWGSYTIIEEVFNDPHGGMHGVNRERLINPAGLGYYTN